MARTTSPPDRSTAAADELPARPADPGAPLGRRSDAAGLGRARAGGFVLPSLVLIVLFLVVPAVWTLYLG